MNRPPSLSWVCAVVLLGALVLGLPVHAGQNVTQSIQLRAGWNSVWLEVAPTNPAPAAVFGTLPVTSVWTFSERLTATDYIQNLSEATWNRSAWLSYVPTNQLESIDNNLFAIQGGRAFLIESEAAATWTVTGRPSFRSMKWVEGAYNLRGFPVDPASPPTFGEFFGPSPAHFNPATGSLAKSFRLQASGEWQPVTAATTILSGEAYWVFANGASDYVAPMAPRLPAGDGLDYGRALPEIVLTFANRRATTATAQVREQQRSQAGTALALGGLNSDGNTTWTDLPALTSTPLPGGGMKEIRLALRRNALAGAQYESVVEVKDGQGIRFVLPVTAERYNDADEARVRAGLWVGTIQVKAVSEAHSGSLITNAVSSTFRAITNGISSGGASAAPLQITRVGVSPTPVATRSEFNLRVIIHVDTNGTPRLLREVTQLWKDGTYTNDALGRPVTATPGQFVLVTDERRIPELKGSSLRDGEPVGRRISAIGFDYPVNSPEFNFLPLTGTFAFGQIVEGTIALGPDHPTNPFRHRYHPDHDNLAGDFRTPAAEAYAIQRQIQFELGAPDPLSAETQADYGYSELAGVYRETLTGLHQYPIHTRGTFRLRRISEIASFNP